MTTDAPARPPLPELPAEIAAAIARTVTYANDDESITVIARGDMTLGSVDVQIFPSSHAVEVGAAYERLFGGPRGRAAVDDDPAASELAGR